MSRARLTLILTFWFSLFSVLVLAAPADAKERQRLGLQLRKMQNMRVKVGDIEEISLGGNLFVFEHKGRIFVKVIGEVTPQADLYLDMLGVRNIRRHGPVITAEVPVDLLGHLAGLKEIRMMRAARRLQKHLDLSVPALPSGSIGMELSRTIVPSGGYYTYPPSSWATENGSGVVFGLVDTGVDFEHDDLQEGGSTRVQFLWDQNTSSYCTQSQMDGGSCSHTDTDGHGTHVTGEAAGDGEATGGGRPAYRVVGVAPRAEIVATATDFSDGGIVDGASYAFEKAEDLGGLPAVVNMSLGGHWAPHDGTDAIETGIDAITGPGQIVVVSAGNEGGDQVNDMGTWSGSNVDLTFNVSSTGGSGYWLIIDIWHNGLDSYQVRVTNPRGRSAIWAVGEGGTKTIDGQSVGVWNPAAGAVEYNGDKNIAFQTSGSLRTGNWTITFIGDSVSSSDPNRIDAWIAIDYRGIYLGAYTTFINSDNSYSVGSPGTAKSTVTVAAYTSKDVWESINGSWYGIGETDETICTFSSIGKTRDERQKPDITAPGSMIAAAMSADSSPMTELTCPDGVHTLIHGTSMSSPHIAGLVALLLQKHPTYTPAAVKSILAYSADRDGYVGSAPNDTWGYGKAHADAALALADANLPSAASAELLPAAAVTNNTLIGRGSGFDSQGHSSPARYLYQWQEHDGAHWINIMGATYRRLEPQLFGSGLVRLVMTPYQHINEPGNYEDLLLGASQLDEYSVGGSSSYASHTGGEGWRMFSIPTQDIPPMSGFAEPFYLWNEETQAYEEATSLERGMGYWIEVGSGEGYLQSSGSAVPAGDYTTPELTYTTDPDFRPGRHLLGNPFNEPIYWQNLEVADAAAPGTYYPVTSASAVPLLYNTFYADYDADSGFQVYDPDDFEARDGKIFPWEGFWVKVKKPVFLRIPDGQSAPPPSAVAGPYPMVPRSMRFNPLESGPEITNQVRPTRPEPASDPVDEGWRLKISAHSGELSDDYNYIGVHAGARDGYDATDIPDAGTLNSQRHVMLTMQHDDWGRESGTYCVDTRALYDRTADDSYRPGIFDFDLPWTPRPAKIVNWVMDLQARGTEHPVTLTWRAPPRGWHLKLVDRVEDVSVDMAESRSYSYTPLAEEASRRFEVVAVPPGEKITGR